jgi:hypothetical protein
MPTDSRRSLKPSKGALVGLMLLLAAPGTGCGHPVQNKLEGRWLGDSVENFDDDAVASATGWAKGASMEFAGSTVTVTIPAEEPRSGKYKVVSVHEGDVELAISRRDGSVDKVRFKLDDERSMRWVLDDGRAVVLRREQ